MLYRCCCLVTAAMVLAALGASSLPAATTVWDFNNNLDASSGYAVMDYRDLTTQSNTSFWPADGMFVPALPGGVANCMWFPQSGPTGGYDVDRPYQSPRLTSYTLLWDLLVPEFTGYNYMGIFNTNPTAIDDSELFIDLRPTDDQGVVVQGRLFVDRDTDNGKVYTPAGVIQPNTWHRIAFAYNENDPSEDIRVFVDGLKVGASDATFGNPVFSLPDAFPVFNDNNAIEHAPGLVASMALVEHAMTDAQIAALGGAKANGFATIYDPGDPPQPPDPPPAGTTAFSDAMAAAHPMVYFRLNEAAGKVAGDPLQNDGSFKGFTPTWGLTGYTLTPPDSGVAGPNGASKVNGHPLIGFTAENAAAKFKGREGTDGADMLDLGRPTELDLDATTWSFWMNTYDTSAWSRLMITDPSYQNLFYVVLNGGDLSLITNASTDTAVNNTAYTTGLGLNDGDWHFIVATRDGDSPDGCELYVDGQAADLGIRRGSWGAGYSFRIGTAGTNSSFFTGTLDEIGIWDHVLSAAEVRDLYYAAIGGAPVYGDANGDGYVDDKDASILGAHWLSSDATWETGDFNSDGMVNDKDAAILAANWHQGTPPGEASVPEPGSLVLLVSALAALAALWRRR
jgi:hypothetical protein